MAERYDVAIKVISQKGFCADGHKVGDEWVIDAQSDKTTGGICLDAFDALYPYMKTLMFGGSFPWSDDPDTVKVVCSDPENPVVFELRRLTK